MAMSPEQRLNNKIASLNDSLPEEQAAKEDISTCYDCQECNNKLKVYYPLNGNVAFRNCNCVSIRISILRARSSGLEDELRRCKFSTFEVVEPWQLDAKQMARAYAQNPDGWLYMCGQVGGGKTHLCTAVVGKLIVQGRSAKYMPWKDTSTEIKGKVNDPEYSRLINPYLKVDVLYIDDFLKTERGKYGTAKPPSVGDINLAFQIINNRYCSGKTTIISSEHTIDEVMGYDEAIGSRIYERSKNNCVIIPTGIGNNYRMK